MGVLIDAGEGLGCTLAGRPVSRRPASIDPTISTPPGLNLLELRSYTVEL